MHRMAVPEQKIQNAVFRYLDFCHCLSKGRCIKVRQSHRLGGQFFQNALRYLFGRAGRLAFVEKCAANPDRLLIRAVSGNPAAEMLPAVLAEDLSRKWIDRRSAGMRRTQGRAALALGKDLFIGFPVQNGLVAALNMVHGPLAAVALFNLCDWVSHIGLLQQHISGDLFVADQVNHGRAAQRLSLPG